VAERAALRLDIGDIAAAADRWGRRVRAEG
jgi:hypothetical protein